MRKVSLAGSMLLVLTAAVVVIGFAGAPEDPPAKQTAAVSTAGDGARNGCPMECQRAETAGAPACMAPEKGASETACSVGCTNPEQDDSGACAGSCERAADGEGKSCGGDCAPSDSETRECQAKQAGGGCKGSQTGSCMKAEDR